jgi:hypothetical protein
MEKRTQILKAHGWQPANEPNVWKHPARPGEEITNDPLGWHHMVPNINAPMGETAVATGINEADLKAHLELLTAK